MTMTEWAVDIGLNLTTLWDRFRRGWSVEKALTHPKRKQKPYAEWAKAKIADDFADRDDCEDT